MLLPLRFWPTTLWIAAGAAAVLLLHAIVLAVQLVIVQLAGGVPKSMGAPDSAPVQPIVESYEGQIIAGFIPGLAVLILGLIAAVSAVRDRDDSIARLGRILLGALALIAVALVGLALPWLL